MAAPSRRRCGFAAPNRSRQGYSKTDVTPAFLCTTAAILTGHFVLSSSGTLPSNQRTIYELRRVRRLCVPPQATPQMAAPISNGCPINRTSHWGYSLCMAARRASCGIFMTVAKLVTGMLSKCNPCNVYYIMSAPLGGATVL